VLGRISLRRIYRALLKKRPIIYRALLKKRPIVLRSLLIVSTPYLERCLAAGAKESPSALQMSPIKETIL